MSLCKAKLFLNYNEHLKFFTRYTSSQSCDKKSLVCDKSKKCENPNIDPVGVIQQQKDICLYSPCPQNPCPIEPCVADLPSTDAIKPEEGFPSRNDASIVIIGAGVAGLSCAQRLIKMGFKNLVVLEAENRPGGRVHSGWLNDTVIEKGADWCSSETNNAFKNHIVQLGVKNGHFNVPLSGVDPSQGLLLQTDCTPLPLPISLMAYSHLADILKAAKCVRHTAPTSQANLANSYIGIRMHQLLKKLPSDMAMICARVLLGLTSYLSPTQRKVVSDSFGAYAAGANMRIPLGYLGALAPLISDIGPERINYSKQVLMIRWGTVLAEQHPRAILKCRDGTSYTADYVVITCPLGVLKDNLGTMFCPSLSPEKTKAIMRMKIGQIGRIFLEYDQPFWIWRDKKLSKEWCCDELKHRTNITRGMVSLQELPGSEYVLNATITGSSVEEMERSTDQEVADFLTAFLKEWTGDSSIPNPKSVIKTNWVTNPHFRGAHSYVSKSDEDNLADAIKEPIPKGCSDLSPILYFAGEHTCSRELMGTVRGAMISGIREAERVIAAIRETPFEQHPCELALATC